MRLCIAEILRIFVEIIQIIEIQWRYRLHLFPLIVAENCFP